MICIPHFLFLCNQKQQQQQSFLCRSIVVAIVVRRKLSFPPSVGVASLSLPSLCSLCALSLHVYPFVLQYPAHLTMTTNPRVLKIGLDSCFANQPFSIHPSSHSLTTNYNVLIPELSRTIVHNRINRTSCHLNLIQEKRPLSKVSRALGENAVEIEGGGEGGSREMNYCLWSRWRMSWSNYWKGNELVRGTSCHCCSVAFWLK